ncbi:hypothetical protein CSOJ01_13328 [Colletotrichum sojae]|uniref:Uncharacterized protein n=1 Tax=Colletotrichum sojae TaxID=2175907 RepID=A0A8H6ITC2_9PEZI|nr:hypothetical protein CSOJ01_13328 [Colletotrichum sojae]
MGQPQGRSHGIEAAPAMAGTTCLQAVGYLPSGKRKTVNFDFPIPRLHITITTHRKAAIITAIHRPLSTVSLHRRFFWAPADESEKEEAPAAFTKPTIALPSQELPGDEAFRPRSVGFAMN